MQYSEILFINGNAFDFFPPVHRLFVQGPIKPKAGPGLDVHSGPYFKSSQNLNIFDELKYIM